MNTCLLYVMYVMYVPLARLIPSPIALLLFAWDFIVQDRAEL